jgi:hypothetical protein
MGMGRVRRNNPSFLILHSHPSPSHFFSAAKGGGWRGAASTAAAVIA